MTRATQAKAPREVAQMYDGVARRYDVTNTVQKRAGCNEVKATILVDENGRMVALLYTTDPEAAC